jgi:hypothetical protein
MAGQHRAGEVVEASRARLAPISLPVRLGLVKAIADYGTATDLPPYEWTRVTAYAAAASCSMSAGVL